jgi:hypothetical protein
MDGRKGKVIPLEGTKKEDGIFD